MYNNARSLARLLCFLSLSLNTNPLDPNWVWTIFKNSFSLKKTQRVCVTRINWSVLFKEIITAYDESYETHKLTLLILIRYVLCSNLGPETRYPDWGFMFFSVLTGKYRDSTPKLGHYRFLPNPFQFIIHLPPFHSTLYSLSHWRSVLK
jgi:hypothetical protein